MECVGDDVPCLSAETAAALQEFLDERMSNEQKEIPDEDWQLSQFWYDSETCDRLSEECLRVTDPGGTIVCISCPSVFIKLCDKLSSQQSTCHKLHLVLLEFDRRFDKEYTLPDTCTYKFVWYDYKEPLSLPATLVESCDTVIVDPPFLSAECLTKTAITVRRLSKNSTKAIVCTGDVMCENVEKLLHCQKILYKPKHRRNLANDFSCFTNYKPVFLNGNAE